MTIVRATFVRNEIEPGWLVLDKAVPIGKVYQVDLDRIKRLTMFNRVTGRQQELECIFVVDPPPGGYLPMGIFKIEANLAGLPVQIASNAECEQATFVVCGDKSYYPDDVHTTCSCGAAIVHRPYVPTTPPKICMACFILISKGPTQ